MPPNQPGTFELIALELSRAFEPIAHRLRDSHAMTLLAELGLELPHGAMTPALEAAFENAVTAAEALLGMTQDLITAIDGGDVVEILAKGVPVVQQVKALITSFDTIATQLGAIGPIPGLSPADLAAFVAELPKRLVETMLVEYLEGYHSLVLAIMEAFGLAEQTRQNVGSTDVLRPEYVKKSLRLDRLGTLLQSPDQLIRDLYGWGQPTFDGALAIQRLDQLLQALDIVVTQKELPGAPPRPAIEIGLLTIAPTDGLTPPGLEATLMEALSDGAELEFPFGEGWVAELAARGALSASVGVRVQPPADVTIIPPSGSVQGRLSAGLARVPVPPTPNLVLLGVAGGSGLTAQRLGFGFVSEFRWDTGLGRAQGDFGFEGEIRGGKLRIAMDQADGFLASLLSGVSLEADFDVGFGWTAGGGVYFTGSSTLEIQLPAHISLGPIDLTAITISVGIQGNKFPIGLSTNIKAALGPLTAVVEQIGASADLSFPSNHSGNLGLLQIDFGFKPPKGVGLSIDTGVIKGGGYLYFDFEKEEYAGALELTISNFLSLKAIGLINTKLPGGQPGFSLLVIITAEFNPGFQLGYGFTLIGVGGLLGLNRVVLLDPLAQGVRTGAVNSILFPTNVIANASKILSDLRAIFPPEAGTFLIGPMAKIGWGTPTLVSVSLGVIIEIPGNVVILGRLRVALPTDEEAVLILQVTFIGALEFDKRRIWFFASMYESRVLFITLEGEMGLLMDYSDNPNFVLSVGGFHPRFTAPPLPFPSPARIVLSLINESWARVRAEAYFAVTSNSVQMGCRAEAFFGFDALSVEGYFSFDALLRFSPFYLIVEISTGFSVKVFGIGLFGVHLRGSLEGPTPWRVRGSAEIEILFFSISVDVDVTFGERRIDTLPPIEVLPKMRFEFEKLESWRATLPPSGQPFVSLRDLGSAGVLVLHPVGTLQISQRFAPLNLPLDKIGNQKPSDVKKVMVAVQAGALAVKGPTKEKFAAAQYRDMDDAAKLSAPAYEPLESGIELGAAGQPWATGPLAQRNVRYETIIIDTAFERFRIRFFKFWDGLFAHFHAGAAVSRATASLANERRMQPFASKVAIAEDHYTVAFQADNKPYASTATFGSYAEAQAHLAEAVRLDPVLSESVHVIPSAEAIQAA